MEAQSNNRGGQIMGISIWQLIIIFVLIAIPILIFGPVVKKSGFFSMVVAIVDCSNHQFDHGMGICVHGVAGGEKRITTPSSRRSYLARLRRDVRDQKLGVTCQSYHQPF